MPEPDEALLWAREDCGEAFRRFKPHLSEAILNGDWDDEAGVRLIAHGYRAGAAASEARIKADDLLAWLEQHPELELSWGDVGDVSEGSWRVHAQHGGVNDREWRLVDVGRTPTEALTNARVQLKEDDQ
jgi:hypothetical protein